MPAAGPAGGVPMTADAYLAAVRAEAAALPSVIISPMAPPTVVPSPSPSPSRLSRGVVLQPPPHATPPRRWAHALLAAFDRLQRRLRAGGLAAHASPDVVPGAKDSRAWRALCWEDGAALPGAAVVARLDYVRVAAALKLFDEWVQPAADVDADADGDAGRVGLRASDALRCGGRAHWLFALLASLYVCVASAPGRQAGSRRRGCVLFP
jgi:hypothetical protein